MKLLDEIVGDDGYVEWWKLLDETPEDINFVNPSNRVSAEEKIDHFFDEISKKFGNSFSKDQVSDLLKRLCLEKASIDETLFEKESVESFLNRTKEAIKQNDIFLTFALNSQTVDFDKYQDYVLDFVTYCYVLEVLCNNLMKNEELFQEVLSSIDNARENGEFKEWKDYATLFQRAKIASILPFIPDLSPKRVQEDFEGKEHVSDTYNPMSRLGLTINITEAVLEDLNHENLDNAKAGYELALMDGLLDFSKFSNEKRVLVAHTSSMYRYSVIPRNWSDLYNAWNLVFVGNFKEFPYYAAKLLFPQVADYDDKPHQYLYPRLLGLWLHIHYVLHEAVKGHDRSEDLSLSKESLKIFGKITLTYAKAYRKFYDELNYELSPWWWIPIDFMNDKIQRSFFWILRKGMSSVNNFERLWDLFIKFVGGYKKHS